MDRILRNATTAALLAATVVLAGCSQGTTASAPTPRREASKETCETPRLTRLPAGLEARDRELVPLSSTLLGVEATFDDGNRRSVSVISGGYLDNVLEAYDDLSVVNRLNTTVGRLTVLEGTLLNDTVRAAYWRQTDVAVPCDVRAVFAVNVAEPAFARMLAGIR